VSEKKGRRQKRPPESPGAAESNPEPRGAAPDGLVERFSPWLRRLLWGLVTAALVAPAYIFGKSWRGEPWDWNEAAGASAVMFIVFMFLASARGYQR
jgi:hypothetical protein